MPSLTRQMCKNTCIKSVEAPSSSKTIANRKAGEEKLKKPFFFAFNDIRSVISSVLKLLYTSPHPEPIHPIHIAYAVLSQMAFFLAFNNVRIMGISYLVRIWLTFWKTPACERFWKLVGWGKKG